MKYKVSGMFKCEVDTENWREAKRKGAEKVHKGDIQIHIISVEEAENEGDKSHISR